jgi:hypothetical protein
VCLFCRPGKIGGDTVEEGKKTGSVQRGGCSLPARSGRYLAFIVSYTLL